MTEYLTFGAIELASAIIHKLLDIYHRRFS